MSLIKRGKSKYWYTQFQVNGQTIVRSTKTTNKVQAQRIEQKLRQDVIEQQSLGDLEPITMKEALDKYYQSMKHLPFGKAVKSFSNTVRKTFNTNIPFEEFTSRDLERLINKKREEGLSTATLLHICTIIRGTQRHAHKLHYKSPKNLEFPKLKKDKGRLRYLSYDEEQRLLNELSPFREGSGLRPYAERSEEMKREQHDVLDFTVTLIDTGARYSEIAKLEWSQIDLEKKEIHLWRPKVRIESIIFMTDRVFNILKQRHKYMNSPKYVFTNKKGKARGYSPIAIQRALKRAGIEEFHIHDFRHTFASRLIQNGCSLYEVGHLLGHSSVAHTTKMYAHLESRDTADKARSIMNKLNQQMKPKLKVVK